MSPRKEKKEIQDSTTEFFLKVVQKDKDKKENATKDNSTLESISSTKTKTLDKMSHFYNYINQILDKILSSRVSIMILSLIMAGVLFTSVSEDFLSSPSSGETLADVPVLVEGLSDSLELTGVPETVKVGLIGPSIDIVQARMSKNYEVYVDVTNLSEGEHAISLKSRNFPDTLQVMIVPDTLKVKLAKKETAKFDLGYRFMKENELDSKYSVSVENMAVSSVNVRASKETLQKIEKVDVCIDVSAKTAAFEQDATVKAYDQNGKVMKVEIAPTTVHVSCNVASYSKDVTVNANFVGEVAQGYQISNYTLSMNQVKIYGPEEKIKDITSVSVDVDVANLKSTAIRVSSFKKDKELGINKYSSDTVDVTVEVEKVITKKFEKIPIKVLNNSNDYKVSFAGESGYATVSVTGIEAKVASLTADNIQATIDVDGLRVGTRRADVKVAVDDDKLKISLLSSARVTINIERN
ncbi:MAG: CdaR family protein [Coprobacillus sp.]